MFSKEYTTMIDSMNMKEISSMVNTYLIFQISKSKTVKGSIGLKGHVMFKKGK
jgi:hypothetical protein